MKTKSFARASALLAAVTLASTVAAQDSNQRPLPQVVITANGEVQVTPDRARISLGVDSEAKTAQEASQLNAAAQTKVIEAIRKAGIPAASIRTSGYNVSPVQEYIPETRKWRVDGYRVTNMVVVVVEPVANAGKVIDAALAAGANRVAGLSFEIKDATSAREQAMTEAVKRARREAELVARAAGGEIVGLIEVMVNSYEQPQPRPMYEMQAMRADAASTPVSEGTQPVIVNVTTRWEYKTRR